MNTSQDSHNPDHANEALDPALLEKLAANLMAMTRADFGPTLPGQDATKPLGETDDGV